ncbi:MAG TPA: DUF1549 domain-containing protein, partial [Planctomycetota bacterium]|nr:DUF1549 domain-containing protein [Planctomycetota bacterium]
MPGSLPQRPRRRVAPRFAPLVLAIVALLLGYDPFGARIASAQSRSRAKGGRSVEEAAREIDRKLEEAWEESFVERSPDLDDGLFLRRLSLDLRGVIPLADEVIRYASDPDPNKASKWAGWFLRSPDYADFFAERWEHILLGRTGGTDGLDREGFRAWLRQAFLTGKPWDEFARELLTTTGTPKDDPASNLFIRFAGANREETAKDVSARIARVFLGTRIECAQCHDHPYMDLKREQFWGLAAFFARTDLRRRVDRAGGQTDLLAVIDLDEGEMRMPPMKEGEEAQPIPPIFFGDKYLASLPKAESAARA